ncbi:hypothetical protein CcCBS67573_g04300 [Chytriomyces confervae]|uniref:C2H2-type domain-containing protein n=1 Tax=Chytriomyces confervae TaxID=246404 RepID=A0A507FDK0_9FUNG|nr:hypothetical protein CcCBS67573_g04300 [Chytriomyces confervae]
MTSVCASLDDVYPTAASIFETAAWPSYETNDMSLLTGNWSGDFLLDDFTSTGSIDSFLSAADLLSSSSVPSNDNDPLDNVVFQYFLNDLTPCSSPLSMFNSATAAFPFHHESHSDNNNNNSSNNDLYSLFVEPVSPCMLQSHSFVEQQTCPQEPTLVPTPAQSPVVSAVATSPIPQLATSHPYKKRKQPTTTTSTPRTNTTTTTTKSQSSRSRNFECSTCGKRCFRKQDLERHQVTHGNLKTFECRLGCGACFARSDALTRHMKTRKCVGDGLLRQ